MQPLPSIRRVALGAALAGAAIGAVPAMASAATCGYDPATKTATVFDDDSTDPVRIGNDGALINVSPSQLCISSGFQFASLTNTDKIVVKTITHKGNLIPHDGVILDESNGAFAPGFTAETDGNSEIEVAVQNLTPLVDDPFLEVIGTPGPDVIRVSRSGLVNFGLDNDTDFSQVGGGSPAFLHISGGAGGDFLSGQGDELHSPTFKQVTLNGGPNDDKLFGGDSGGDHLNGDGGDDSLRSVDGRPDFLSGGPGFDNALYDAVVDIVNPDVESPPIQSVGQLRLAPRSLRAAAGATAHLRMSWTHPKAWRELRTIDVGLYRGATQVGMVAIRPAGERLKANGAVRVMPDASRITHHGKTVTAKLALRLDRSLAGQDLRIDVRATDRHGHTQTKPNAGVIHVVQ